MAEWSMPVGSTVLLPVRLPAKLAPAYPAGASFLPDAAKARGATQFDRSLRGIASAVGSDRYASSCPYDTINNRKTSVVGPLVPRHSDYDWLILSQSWMGRSFGATRICMLRATPGWRRMRPGGLLR